MGRLEVVILVVTTAYVTLVIELVRRRTMREKYALMWLAVGFAVAVLAFSRPVLDRLAPELGISYGPTVLFLAAIMFLLAVAAHLSWEVSRLEEKTRRLAEEIALLRVRHPDEPLAEDGPERTPQS